jgi:hypothetical protein
MSLISPANLLADLDVTGKVVTRLTQAIDLANLDLRMVPAQLSSQLGAVDPTQFASLLQIWQGTYLASGVSSFSAAGASSTAFTGAFGGIGGGGGFGVGTGLINRTSIFRSFDALFTNLNNILRAYAKADGLTAITDINTYFAYYNGSAYTYLCSPDLASLYWWAFGSGTQQLSKDIVFAPAGIVLCHFAITGVGAGTLSNNAATNWPSANGYSTPAPTTTGGTGTYDAGDWDAGTAYTMGPPIPVVQSGGSYWVAVASSTGVTPGTNPAKWVACTFGNPVYVGGMPMAQAFAPIAVPAVKVTTNINGTCTVTVTASNQAGTSHTWSCNADNATAGTIINLTPGTGGDRMNAVPSVVAVAGTATAGAFDIVTTAERTP